MAPAILCECVTTLASYRNSVQGVIPGYSFGVAAPSVWVPWRPLLASPSTSSLALLSTPSQASHVTVLTQYSTLLLDWWNLWFLGYLKIEWEAAFRGAFSFQDHPLDAGDRHPLYF